MQRKPNIKWRDSDAEKLEKEIQRFNAKVYYNRKKHPELEDILPNPINKASKAKLIESFKEAPRSEFNKGVKSLERFNQRGSEKIVTSKTGNSVTRWEKNEVAYKVAQINRERAKERKLYESLPATSQGKALNYTRGEMGSERLNELQPKKFDFNKIRKGKEWEKFKETVNAQSSYTHKLDMMEGFKNNYYLALEEFGGYASDIQKIIEMLPAEKEMETYYKEQEATITFIYEKDDEDSHLEVIREIWENALDEYLNGGEEDDY
jgi:hypothetical protein